jgi:hypothetical protein
MKLRTIAAGLLAAAVVPAAAVADGHTQADKVNGARYCQAQKTTLGDTAFKALYGTNESKSNAMGKCVSKWAQASAQARQTAQSTCRAERQDANFAATHGGKSFAEFYGAKNAGQALGKCIAAKQQAQVAAEHKATVKAGQACKTELKTMGATAFKAKYGGKANAFGKCVSKLASAKTP